MPKAGDKNPDKRSGKKAKAVAKPAAKHAPTKAAKNSPVKSAAPAAKPAKAAPRAMPAPAPKAAPAPAAAAKAKPVESTTGATGRDHPAVTEHSAQAEVTRKLYEQLQARKNPGSGPGAPGQRKGFDPNQFRGGKGGHVAGGHAQMIRRTQGRGGGAGGGGGGGSGGGA